MKDYEKHIISQENYLHQMGNWSLKADRESKRLPQQTKDIGPVTADDAVNSDDSLSETRPWSNAESSDEEVPAPRAKVNIKIIK